MVSLSKVRPKLVAYLPQFVFLLLVIQPVMDVFSFWTGQWGMSNTLTLLLRLGVLGLTILAGFSVSSRKGVYWAALGVIAVIGLGHMYACWDYGYANIITDMTNYIRVALMPMTALSLITFLKENDDCYRAMKWGLLTCTGIILAVELLATLTGTDPHTYSDGQGTLGWFNNTNSQSAIITMLSPLAVAWTYRRGGLRSPIFWVTTIGCFAAMYFMGPRLCFLGIVATGFGLGISMILIRPRLWKRALVFFAAALVCLSLIPLSPMVAHQAMYEGVQEDRQDSINDQLAEETLEPLSDMNNADLTEEEREALRQEWIEALTPIYTFYTPDFVEMFGAERTIEMYNYTSVITEITATRPKKLQFARLLMDHSPVSARVFGLELDRFTVGENIYDVENDLHGIYFLYGYVGLAGMVAFLGYFLYLIGRALLTDAKKYFTWDAAAWGIALCMCFAHVYNTAGVLRRPNAAVYLSVVLAAIYYLVKIKRYPDEAVTLPAED